MNPLLMLKEHGQSYWLDNLTRAMLAQGELARRVEYEGLGGVTSNPAIFNKAILGSSDYRSQIEHAADHHLTTEAIYDELTTTDVRQACDVLRPVYERTGGADGYVSLEVSPHLARDARGSIDEGQRLAQLVGRPNLLIKIPGTTEGCVAVEELLLRGINVNITLLFAVERYEAVAQAYIRALERRLQAGLPLQNIHSVASFFLSRIDTLVDQLLAHRMRPGDAQASRLPESLLGHAAIANAKLAYASFQAMLDTARWKDLSAQGARPQRLLWASTSTKNPAYPDTFYVEPLIGPHTINTMPPETIAAFAEHGTAGETLAQGLDDARQSLEQLATLGIDIHLVTSQLENEGIQKFIDPYDQLMRNLDAQRQKRLNRSDEEPLREMARLLRIDSIRMTTEAGSGHPTSCLSCAEIMATLFFHEMRWDPAEPHARDTDTFILSKGHAAPILWAALHAAGALTEDLLTLRRIDSILEGHPTPRNPWVKVATGSLGQGLAAANGLALANRLDRIDARVYCLLGDGECSEGSVWEAAQFAALNHLQGIVAIIDLNGLGQSGPTPFRHDAEVLARRFAAFGWHTQVVNGHRVNELLDALYDAQSRGPSAIIACTEKGKGISFLEGAPGWHGKALDRDEMARALSELGVPPAAPMRVVAQHVGMPEDTASASATPPPIEMAYALGQPVATRDAFGHALKKLGALHPDIVALDGDVQDSTRTKAFAKAYPSRFFEGYIAEQNMAGTGLGLAAGRKVPVVATFACFLSRAYDFIRMAGHSEPRHLVFCGSHAGISIGQDGPSQMGLEDLAMFRAVHGSTIFYPCDAVSAERVTEQAVTGPGLVYIRTTRPATPVVYGNAETFPVGGAKVLRSSEHDRATLVAAGITVHEALAAHEALKQKGVMVRVIDAYCVKPLATETLRAAARETATLFVVEDHWIEGGLGDAVASAVSGLGTVHKLAVSEEPRSGEGQELLERFGISRRAIEARVMSALSQNA
ncbi:MAG: transketolase [Betaproteobacteria bacterium]|nr:transketolase [Betaproteobacteria bacterium]